MLKECKSCQIWTDKVCDECTRYQKCLDNGIDFVTGENAPAVGFDGCFRCAFLAKSVDHCLQDD